MFVARTHAHMFYQQGHKYLFVSSLSRLCYLPLITVLSPLCTLHSPCPCFIQHSSGPPLLFLRLPRTSLCLLNLPSSCLSSCHFLPCSLAPSSALSFILSTSCLLLFFPGEVCVDSSHIFSPVIPSPRLTLIPPSPTFGRIGLSHWGPATTHKHFIYISQFEFLITNALRSGLFSPFVGPSSPIHLNIPPKSSRDPPFTLLTSSCLLIGL